ncbi:MAG: hypothetical protein ACTJHM_03770 [Agrococcus casei]|uniref:hypothetical protein n=1 Tax=Agrococcus casei TaxID=343512 RepID=UPI003F8F9535
MPDVSSDWGSFAFPGAAVRESAESYIQHFSNAPIAEQVLANAVTAYKEWSTTFIEDRAVKRTTAYFDHDPVGMKESKALDGRGGEARIAFDRKYREFSKEVQKEYGLPTKLVAGKAAVVVRAAQMQWQRSLLVDEEEQDAVMHHRMMLGHEEMTVADISERYQTWKWLEDAATNLGDLRTQRILQALLNR